MKKTSSTIITLALAATAFTAIAADGDSNSGGMMGMNKMDANGDNMISKEEFMKSHETMFDQMKGQNGMIDMNSMHKSCMGMMMGQGGMMGHDGMTGK